MMVAGIVAREQASLKSMAKLIYKLCVCVFIELINLSTYEYERCCGKYMNNNNNNN